MKRGKADKRDIPFEQAMEQLEEVVSRLETGDIPLEESLAAFEKGVGLVRLLHTRLDNVQRKIEELVRGEGGEVVARPLDGVGEGDAEEDAGDEGTAGDDED